MSRRLAAMNRDATNPARRRGDSAVRRRHVLCRALPCQPLPALRFAGCGVRRRSGPSRTSRLGAHGAHAGACGARVWRAQGRCRQGQHGPRRARPQDWQRCGAGVWRGWVGSWGCSLDEDEEERRPPRLLVSLRALPAGWSAMMDACLPYLPAGGPGGGRGQAFRQLPAGGVADRLRHAVKHECQ